MKAKIASGQNLQLFFCINKLLRDSWFQKSVQAFTVC